MAHTLLEQIESAERQAEDIINEAKAQAGEMLKAADEANLLAQREAEKKMRKDAAKQLADAAIATGDEIKALELRRSTEREALKRYAQARVLQTSRSVFERIVGNGDC